MKRRNFIRETSLTGLTLMTIPHLALAQEPYSEAELIGKSEPPLAGEGARLRTEVYEAFLKMKQAALQEGIQVKIESGYRSFQRQKAIWEGKYTDYTKRGMSPEKAIRKITEYSTIPGTSRHHWGTDMDIIDAGAGYKGNDVLQPKLFREGAPFYRLKKWLDGHASSFGFALVYTDDPLRKGFKYEPWHYSYTPVSIPMLQAYRRQIDLKKLLKREAVLGSEHFSDAFIERYTREHILDINPGLMG